MQQCLCGLNVYVVSVVYVSFELRFDASASSIMLPREVEMMLDCTGLTGSKMQNTEHSPRTTYCAISE